MLDAKGSMRDMSRARCVETLKPFLLLQLLPLLCVIDLE